MNILFIIKMRILVLIKWSNRSVPIMVTIESIMVLYFEHVVHSPLNICLFGIHSWSHI